MLYRTLPYLGLIVTVALGFMTFPQENLRAALANDAPAPVEATTQEATESAPADTAALKPWSVYNVDAAWTNQHGEALQLKDLRGTPQLVAFVFTNCGYACPRIVHDMKEIIKSLPEGQRDQVGATLISIDPERDTEEVMHHYAKMHELPSPQWTLLRSNDDTVRELAAVLGIRYKRESDGQFAHSNTLTLLNAEGEVALQLEGLGTDASELTTRLTQMIGR